MVNHRNPLVTHEAVYNFEDDATGVKAIIAVHSTSLGPAAGGCRALRYENYNDAVEDALRLSEGMAYKNALAGLPFGGGKAVLMLPANASAPDFDRTRMFETFGRWVQSLDGAYVTAEDVGCSVQDMQAVGHSTQFVAGLPARPGLAAGTLDSEGRVPLDRSTGPPSLRFRPAGPGGRRPGPWPGRLCPLRTAARGGRQASGQRCRCAGSFAGCHKICNSPIAVCSMRPTIW